VRPVVEAVVRAHVALMCSDSELGDIKEDKYKVDFKELPAKMDAYFGLDGLLELRIIVGFGEFSAATRPVCSASI